MTLQDIPRRTVMKGAAWSVPVVAATVAAPLAAASPPLCSDVIGLGSSLSGTCTIEGQRLTVTGASPGNPVTVVLTLTNGLTFAGGSTTASVTDAGAGIDIPTITVPVTGATGTLTATAADYCSGSKTVTVTGNPLARRTALDYFQARGASDAAQVLTDADITEYLAAIDLDDDRDAANLQHMLDSLDYIDESNALRARHGLAPWQVTDTLMAIAIANTDWSINNSGHPNQFQVAENLASASTPPFPRWYDEEKAIYEEALLDSDTYPGLATMTGYEVYQAYPSLYNDVGHYLNIIDPNTTLTGFAKTTRPGRFSSMVGQVMAFPGATVSTRSGTSLSHGRIMTVDNYRTDLQAFIDSCNG